MKNSCFTAGWISFPVFFASFIASSSADFESDRIHLQNISYTKFESWSTKIQKLEPVNSPVWHVEHCKKEQIDQNGDMIKGEMPEMLSLSRSNRH